MNMRERAINNLKNLSVDFKVDIEDQYVNSITKVSVGCVSCGVPVMVLPGNLLRIGHANCKPCRYAKSSASRKIHNCPEWFYGRFKSIYSRCNNPNNQSYKNYGGRGIALEFLSPSDMWIYVSGLDGCCKSRTIDRANNEKGYEKGNLRWVDMTRQNRNRRQSPKFGLSGLKHSNMSKSYQVSITVNYKTIYIGSFPDFLDACCARKSAENTHWRDENA